MRFTYIKKSFEEGMLIDVFKSLIGHNCDVILKDDAVIFFHNYDNINDINDLMMSLGSELVIDILGYTSMVNSKEKLNVELAIASDLLNNFKTGMYDIRKILLHSNLISNKKAILDYILSDTGIDERFILDFIEADLNVSKASKLMYVHRNTLIYKLDKFKELTGFDLKCFKDAFVLYNLIENK